MHKRERGIPTSISTSPSLVSRQFHLAVLLIFLCIDFIWVIPKIEEKNLLESVKRTSFIFEKLSILVPRKNIQNTLFCANFSTRKINSFVPHEKRKKEKNNKRAAAHGTSEDASPSPYLCFYERSAAKKKKERKKKRRKTTTWDGVEEEEAEFGWCVYLSLRYAWTQTNLDPTATRLKFNSTSDRQIQHTRDKQDSQHTELNSGTKTNFNLQQLPETCVFPRVFTTFPDYILSFK